MKLTKLLKPNNLDYTVVIAQNFCHSGCVSNVAWSQYNIASLSNEVTKQALVQFYIKGIDVTLKVSENPHIVII